MTVVKKNFVLICHEKVDKDEVTGQTRFFLNIPGQFAGIAGSMFTDVWRAEVEEKPGMPPTYRYVLRTMPNFLFSLKNSLGLPPMFEFSWPTIEAKLKGTT